MSKTLSQRIKEVNKKYPDNAKKIELRNSVKNNKRCVYCGCDNPLIMTVDHIKPRARGGKDSKDNLQACCWVCNQLKGALTHAEFKKYYAALKSLHKLCKVRIANLPPSLVLKFTQNHFPGFWSVKNGKKTMGNKEEEGQEVIKGN